jgi:hypothetical protein
MTSHLVLLNSRDFFSAVDGFVLGSSGYYGWIFLAAAHADGLLWSGHEECVYLPMILMNLVLFLKLSRWAYRHLRTHLDEDEEFGPVFALGYFSLTIWNIFWLVLAFSTSSLVVKFTPLWIMPYGPPALVVVIIACVCPCACPYACYKSVTDEEFRGDGCPFIGLYGLLALVCFADLFLGAFLVVLKAQGAIDWQWRYVFIPVWIIDVMLVPLLVAITGAVVAEAGGGIIIICVVSLEMGLLCLVPQGSANIHPGRWW